MGRHFSHPKVFIRSLATRGSLGGLSSKTMEITDVLRSEGFDLILIETVGVGQSEMEIATLADVTALVLVPESGDDIQAVKAGLIEVADIIVINKSDRPGASLMESFVLEAARLDPAHQRPIQVIQTIATEARGTVELLKAVLSCHTQITPAQKENLLFEKAIRLIRDYKMNQIDREALRRALKEKAGKEFNLYSFTRAFAR